MSSETDEAASTATYELDCTDCGFETTVDGDVHDALDVAEAHEDAHAKPHVEHFVDFELVEETE